MKKKLFLSLFVLKLYSFCLAQNQLYIQSGAVVTLTGTADLYLQNLHLENNGTLQGASNSLVTFTGNAAGSIKGGGINNFGILHCNNSNGMLLENHINIETQLQLSSPLFKNNRIVTLNSTATIQNEGETNRLYDVSGNSGYAVTTRNFSAPLVNVHPANIGVEFISAPVLGVTEIRRYGTAYIRNGSSTGLINRFYKISSANNSGLNATVRFYYLDAELNGVDENTAVLWKSEDNGTTWHAFTPTSKNTTANHMTLSGINDFSLWTIGAPTSVLPVVISAFNVNCSNDNNRNGAELVWTSALEENTKYYIIEKSSDGINWQTLYQLNAKGTPNTYNYNDETMQDDNNASFYRLKTVFNNGNSEISNIIRSTCGSKNITLLLFPNPAEINVTASFYASSNQKTTAQIIDGTGKVVQQLTTNIQKGTNQIRFNIHNLSSGSYYLQLSVDNKVMVTSFIKK